MNELLFLDTNVLLEDIGSFEGKNFAISSKTLEELENIKTSRTKSEDVKAAARKVTRWLADHHGEYQVVIFTENEYEEFSDLGVDFESPDVIICACAASMNKENKVKFVTHDLNCRIIAEQIFGLDVEWFEDKEENEYTGFKEASMSDDEMAYFYEHQNENMYDLLVNQYLIIKNVNNEIVDSYRWDGESYQTIYKKSIKSTFFDKLKPKDIYQTLMVDSIMNNTITAVSAKAGAGKSLISLMCAMSLIETGKYDRLCLLHNPVKVRGAADSGYFPGTANEKALANSVGNMLSTKFGDQFGVELLIQQGKIKLVSLADCRGMEIRDNEILYMTECQNTTTELIKLALSRVSAGAKVIIEGDYKTQVDSYLFEGKNNGLKRVIDAFKGHEEFGYIELQNIWRSKLAQLAELL